MQIIEQVKDIEGQIMDYLKVQRMAQERTRAEMEDKYREILEGRTRERGMREEELDSIVNKIKNKRSEISKMDVMIEDVSKDNDSNLEVSFWVQCGIGFGEVLY